MIAMIATSRRADVDDEEAVGKPRRRWLDRSAGPLDGVLILAISLIVVFVFTRPLVVEVFDIPSSSMEPTLASGDHVLIAKFAYRLGEPAMGDIAAFQNPEARGGVLIKRIVGLPGDTVGIRDGVLYVNGEREQEDYVNYRLNDGNFFGPVRVPSGEVFVMGDNRANSRDSRTFGSIPERDLAGKALLRLWPAGRIGEL